MALLFLIIILGASIGSFLTVVIFRTSTQETIIFRHSRCSNCRHRLHPHDLIPMLSYLLRGGKCAYCKTRISGLYPLIELTTTLAFVLAFFISVLVSKDILTQLIIFFCQALLFSVLLVILFRYLNKNRKTMR